MPDHYSRIFLLSHMRACTSLAGHILGSHPQINGYFEMHIGYEDAAALDKQLEIFRQYETPKAGAHYLFDKLLHNEYPFNPAQLGLTDMKILVSLLEPEQTIKSIVALFAKKPGEDLYASPQEATRYYIERVKSLADFCESAGQPYCYYDAEALLAAPESLLPRLTDWLALDSPLSQHYQRFSQTGKAGKGDSSAAIHSGRIEKVRSDYSHISLPEDALQQAQAVYRDCRSMIIDHATDAFISRSQALRSAR